MAKLTVYCDDALVEVLDSLGTKRSTAAASILRQALMQWDNPPKPIQPSEIEAAITSPFTISLPNSVIAALDVRAEAQHLTRRRYIASTLTSHVCAEPVYDRQEQADLSRTIEALHALTMSLQGIRVAMKNNRQATEALDAKLNATEQTCSVLLQQINQMRQSSVERWKS